MTNSDKNGSTTLSPQPAEPDLDDAFKLSPARAEKLMRERAFKLASVSANEQKIFDMELVSFALSAETYAIETCNIREIAALHSISRVPGAPDFIAGVINLHGQIVALVDLKKVFGLQSTEWSAEAKVLILGTERTEFGIVADSVDTVLKIQSSDLREPPDTITGAGRDHLLGVTLEALIVLDGKAMIQDKRLFVNQTNDSLHSV
ncbi:MAG: purine-binding chemotaxis protein CheW [Candidatus Melainabacteria bacterium]|nr:purine-binding chemotaxis protein CheW [Candidatus Melainabacteria bacterium]